jgi:GAF domain-containing protein
MATKQEILKRRANACSRRAASASCPLLRHQFFDLAAQWLELAAVQQALEAQRDYVSGCNRLSAGKARLEILNKREAWRRGQRQAFELALIGGALTPTLEVLTATARDLFGEGVRAAFYVANPAGTTLHHIVGMPAAYAEAVDGFKIGPDSLACGLATYTGRPILTADVLTDPRWRPWRSMADKFDYRGCWSFPIRTSVRRGSFAIYSTHPRGATPVDVDLAELITQTAAIIIDRHIREKPS